LSLMKMMIEGIIEVREGSVLSCCLIWSTPLSSGILSLL
jgi:hypothetical protein